MSGPNAIRVLEELGILEAVIAKSDEHKPTLRSFLFVSGLEHREQIYDVW